MAEIEKKRNILDILSKLVSLGFISALFTGCIWVYNNFLIAPILQYNDNTGEFTAQSDFRGISMRVYPQMQIRVNTTVFQMTHLAGYFEEEMIHFQDRKASVKEMNPEYAEKLLAYVRTGILNELETAFGREIAEQIGDHLMVSISFICGVQYQTPYGNDIRKYCIIERNGLLVDCKTDVKEIQERLYESELTLNENPDMIAMDPQIAEIIRVSATEIGRVYGNNSQLP